MRASDRLAPAPAGRAARPAAVASIQDAASRAAPAPNRRHYLLFAAVYTAFIVYGSWVPLRPAPIPLEDAWSQYVAVLTATDGRPGRIDFCTNVVIFVPLSFLWMAAVLTDRRPRAWLPGALVVAAGSTALSLTVEFGQVWVERTPSRFDVYAQLLGATGGLLAWLAAGRRSTAWLRAFAESRRANDRLDWALKTYFGLLFVSSVMPLDLTIHPYDLYEKYRDGRIVVVPFANTTGDYESLLDLLFAGLLSVPVGALGVRLWPVERRSWRSLARGIATGVGLVAAIEFAQLFVASRFSETGDVLVGAAGVSTGAWLTWRAAREPDGRPVAARSRNAGPSLRWAALAVAWLAVPCLFFWSPFEFTADPGVVAARWNDFLGVPFYNLYLTPNLNAHTQLLRKVLLFAPFGMLLAGALRRRGAWQPRTRGERARSVLAAITGVVAAAFAVELGQVFVPERYPDMTDALLMSAGGVLGLWLAFKVSTLEAQEGRDDDHRTVPHMRG